MTTIGIPSTILLAGGFLAHTVGVFIFVFIVYHLIIVPIVESLDGTSNDN